VTRAPGDTRARSARKRLVPPVRRRRENNRVLGNRLSNCVLRYFASAIAASYAWSVTLRPSSMIFTRRSLILLPKSSLSLPWLAAMSRKRMVSQQSPLSEGIRQSGLFHWYAIRLKGRSGPVQCFARSGLDAIPQRTFNQQHVPGLSLSRSDVSACCARIAHRKIRKPEIVYGPRIGPT